MENLLFSLNATLPIFLTMVLGAVFKKVGLFDEDMAAKLNRFVFRIGLPMLLFQDLAVVDFGEVWDGKFVLFCFGTTVLSIIIAFLLSFLLKNRSQQGEFIQASYRSSAAIIGIAFIQNIYGTTGMAPLMIVATVPLYNIMAVVVLSFMKPDRDVMGKTIFIKTVKEIATNPIIIGIGLGVVWSFCKLSMPVILEKTLKNVASLATPLGLMSMGITFEWKRMGEHIRPVLGASFVKLAGLVAVFLPIAVMLGFREEKLIAILVMLGSATTVSSYIMCRNMGHEGKLTSMVIMLTTLCSAFTLTTWLFVIKSFAFI